MKMKKFLILILFVSVTTVLLGQDDYQDVIYLKDGSIIRGMIIEQVPGKSIKIETPERHVFVYQMDKIEKITKEKVEISIKKEKYTGKQKGFIGLELGANIPIGKFADINDGAATTGFQINFVNFGYLFSENVGVTATWFGASNSIEGGGSDYLWSHGGLLVGPLFSFPVSEKIEWDIIPMIGLSWASITNIGLETASAFAFNVGTGFRFNVSHLIALTLGMDYTTAKFKWDIGEQSMGTLAIKGGFAFRLK
jgi:hypothetical protein